MSEHWGDSQRDRDALDRHITGNYGEDQLQSDDEKLLAVATDAGLLPPEMRHTVVREHGHPHLKGGWITLNWEEDRGDLARDNEGNDSGIREVTILVSTMRALQAMTALARDELIV